MDALEEQTELLLLLHPLIFYEFYENPLKISMFHV